MNRRSFLRLTAAMSAALSPLALPSSSSAASRKEMERYFALLWIEHKRVADELGIDMFDHVVLHNAIDHNAMTKALDRTPTPVRAKAVLTALEVAS